MGTYRWIRIMMDKFTFNLKIIILEISASKRLYIAIASCGPLNSTEKPVRAMYYNAVSYWET